MDAATLLNLGQTVGVLAALVYTGIEFRARRKELKFRNYLDSISGFGELARLMVEKPELQGLYEYSKQDITLDYESLSPAQKARVNYCDAIIALCETIWLADKKGWVDEDEWQYWKRWLKELNQSPEFRWAVRWVKGDYDEEFMQEISW